MQNKLERVCLIFFQNSFQFVIKAGANWSLPFEWGSIKCSDIRLVLKFQGKNSSLASLALTLQSSKISLMFIGKTGA